MVWRLGYFNLNTKKMKLFIIRNWQQIQGDTSTSGSLIEVMYSLLSKLRQTHRQIDTASEHLFLKENKYIQKTQSWVSGTRRREERLYTLVEYLSYGKAKVILHKFSIPMFLTFFFPEFLFLLLNCHKNCQFLKVYFIIFHSQHSFPTSVLKATNLSVFLFFFSIVFFSM